MTKPKVAGALAAILMATALSGCTQQAHGGTDDAARPWAQLLAASADPTDWVTYGGTFDEQRFSRCCQSYANRSP